MGTPMAAESFLRVVGRGTLPWLKSALRVVWGIPARCARARADSFRLSNHSLMNDVSRFEPCVVTMGIVQGRASVE